MSTATTEIQQLANRSIGSNRNIPNLRRIRSIGVTDGIVR